MNNDDYLFLRDSINEILIYLGASNSNPISVSNLCMHMGISRKEKDLMQVKFCKLSSELSESKNKLKLEDCRSIIESVHSPNIEMPFSDEIILGFVNGFANLIPDLKDLITDLTI